MRRYSNSLLRDTNTRAHLSSSQADCERSAGDLRPWGQGRTCPVIWDGWLCWPRTLAGSTIKQPCPAIFQFNTQQFAYRKCTRSGTWHGAASDVTNPKDPGWSNYTLCVLPSPTAGAIFPPGSDVTTTVYDAARSSQNLAGNSVSLQTSSVARNMAVTNSHVMLPTDDVIGSVVHGVSAVCLLLALVTWVTLRLTDRLVTRRYLVLLATIVTTFLFHTIVLTSRLRAVATAMSRHQPLDDLQPPALLSPSPPPPPPPPSSLRRALAAIPINNPPCSVIVTSPSPSRSPSQRAESILNGDDTVMGQFMLDNGLGTVSPERLKLDALWDESWVVDGWSGGAVNPDDGFSHGAGRRWGRKGLGKKVGREMGKRKRRRRRRRGGRDVSQRTDWSSAKGNGGERGGNKGRRKGSDKGRNKGGNRGSTKGGNKGGTKGGNKGGTKGGNKGGTKGGNKRSNKRSNKEIGLNGDAGAHDNNNNNNSNNNSQHVASSAKTDSWLTLCQVGRAFYLLTDLSTYSFLFVVSFYYTLVVLGKQVTFNRLVTMFLLGVGLPVLCVTFTILLHTFLPAPTAGFGVSCAIDSLGDELHWATTGPKLVCVVLSMCLMTVCTYGFWRLHVPPLNASSETFYARQGVLKTLALLLACSLAELFLLVTEYQKMYGWVSSAQPYVVHASTAVAGLKGSVLAALFCFADCEVLHSTCCPPAYSDGEPWLRAAATDASLGGGGVGGWGGGRGRVGRRRSEEDEEEGIGQEEDCVDNDLIEGGAVVPGWGDSDRSGSREVIDSWDLGEKV